MKKEGSFSFEKSDKYGISPEFLKNVERSKLTVDDKVNFLLTKGGLKPASEITLVIKSWYKGEINEHMNEKDVEETLTIIKESNLPFQIEERKVVKEKYYDMKEPDIEKVYEREQINILVGHSKEDLDFLIEARQTKNDELLGKAFGFSPTAIEAFVGKRKKLDINSLPREIQESDALLFSSPTLSEDNWQEEVKQGQLYADFIKDLNPNIYREVLAIKRNKEK